MSKLTDDIDDDNLSKYSYILQSYNPDKYIEYFWYYFKNSIINFCNYDTSKNFGKKQRKRLKKKIASHSKQLNYFQQTKQYLNIEDHIKNFIYYCIFIMFKNRTNKGHYNILITNVKRWNKICSDINKVEIININNQEDPIIKNKIRLQNQILIFSYIYNKMKYQYGSIYDKLPLISRDDCDHNYTILCEMLDISIRNKHTGFIDMISHDVDIYDFINIEYGTCFQYPIRAVKIIRQMTKLSLI